MGDIRLNIGQILAYNVVKSGVNTFITGGQGVGKTCFIKTFIENESDKINIMVTAPTGMAALNIGGVTLHRQFHIPLGVIDFSINNTTKKSKSYSYDLDDALINTDMIIIDEISMCRLDIFDFVCSKIADANNIRKRRGLKVIQLVVVGDFFQLAPVMRGNEKAKLDEFYKKDVGAGFAFMSRYWSLMNFKTVNLTETVRQQDNYFIDNLNKLRTGEKAYIDYVFNNSCKEELRSAVTICGKNSEVEEKNRSELSRIDSEVVEYIGIKEGEVLESDLSVDFVLQLKEGARVITLVNKNSFKNGSLGTIEALYDDTVVVQMDNGATEYIERFTWDIYRYEIEDSIDSNNIGDEQNNTKITEGKLVRKEVGKFTQFPLKLAYAITIHKSQGQTYDAVNLSPYSWDCGQLYVAVSRVRSLDKLHFNYEPDMKYLVTSLNVIKFYNSLEYINSTEQLHELLDKENTKSETAQVIDKDIEDDMNKLLSMF